MNPVRVIIVEDHPVVRSGILYILNQTDAIYVIGQAQNGVDALALVEEHQPDILLLDMELPGMSGLEVARQVHTNFPAVKILALSGHADRYYVKGILALGASGYLTKDETADLLVQAILGVSQGETGWFSQRISDLMTNWEEMDLSTFDRLSPREKDVLKHLTDGKSNQQIALELGISAKTVEKYLYSLYEKLGVNSRVGAAVVQAKAMIDQER
jgi:DNA-binding NarL/FixJ family response regulator